MFNPFVPFTKPLLDAFISKNKKFFIRQTYQRGMPLAEPTVKGAFLITHYDVEKEAIVHYDALNRDANRFFYEVDNPEHLEKLNIAATNPGPYRIFAGVAYPGWEECAKAVLMPKVKRYIDHGLKWKPSRDESVNLKLYAQFGEVYAQLNLRNQKIEVRLDEIENFK